MKRLVPFTAAAAAATLAVAGVAVAQPSTSITTVLGGLNNPRSLAVDGSGSLYVTQAGPYGGSDPFHATRTESGDTTGSLSKIRRPGTSRQQTAWSTPFPGVWTNENGSPEVLGASGVSVRSGECEEHGRAARRCDVRVLTSESKPGYLVDHPGVTPPALGTLSSVNRRTGAATELSNVGQQMWDWTNAHTSLAPLDFPDSNPYGVLVTRSRSRAGARTFVVDAGANTVSEVAANGTATVIAYIPNDPTRDSTPTCVAEGPDRALYVGTLDMFQNGFGPPTPGSGPGNSSIWRIDPSANGNFLTAAQKWATGFTTITSCTFDRSGNLWATEMFTNDVVRVSFRTPTSQKRYGDATTTPLPGGIAPAGEKGMYVSINSLTTTPGTGAVVRLRVRGGERPEKSHTSGGDRSPAPTAAPRTHD
jgi:hypothetical protein